MIRIDRFPRSQRAAFACLAGTVLVASACVAAAPAPAAAPIGTTPHGEAALARAAIEAAVADASAAPPVVDDAAGSAADGGCPHGVLEDPHRGFVRCLAASEADAGVGQVAPNDPGDAGAPSDAGQPEAAVAPLVEIGEPVFQNGEVPKVAKALGKSADEIGRCVASHGGLSGAAGSIKLQFLVRSRGRAEGVEVESAKGITEAAKECVRRALKNRGVGAPTADPVGVTVTVSLHAPK